ncbi:uncharacterized protein LOC131232696 isoform X2 [Magnolia sinica]|uniref:uncharacterized protein LOC131232696 isoform X2 n=1 Tax=Magnolia sinica TaxID=86752 RepID=UPI002658876B|nr:uncharacterized protein LOC131232696 isoform X2 [Magnolia sinica]
MATSLQPKRWSTDSSLRLPSGLQHTQQEAMIASFFFMLISTRTAPFRTFHVNMEIFGGATNITRKMSGNIRSDRSSSSNIDVFEDVPCSQSFDSEYENFKTYNSEKDDLSTKSVRPLETFSAFEPFSEGNFEGFALHSEDVQVKTTSRRLAEAMPNCRQAKDHLELRSGSDSIDETRILLGKHADSNNHNEELEINPFGNVVGPEQLAAESYSHKEAGLGDPAADTICYTNRACSGDEDGLREIADEDDTALRYLVVDSALDEVKSNSLLLEGSNMVGRKVHKLFGRKKYSGEVISYDTENSWFKVLYEDGDEEDLEREELEAVLVPLNRDRKRPVDNVVKRERIRPRCENPNPSQVVVLESPSSRSLGRPCRKRAGKSSSTEEGSRRRNSQTSTSNPKQENRKRKSLRIVASSSGGSQRKGMMEAVVGNKASMNIAAEKHKYCLTKVGPKKQKSAFTTVLSNHESIGTDLAFGSDVNRVAVDPRKKHKTNAAMADQSSHSNKKAVSSTKAGINHAFGSDVNAVPDTRKKHNTHAAMAGQSSRSIKKAVSPAKAGSDKNIAANQFAVVDVVNPLALDASLTKNKSNLGRGVAKKRKYHSAKKASKNVNGQQMMVDVYPVAIDGLQKTHKINSVNGKQPCRVQKELEYHSVNTGHASLDTQILNMINSEQLEVAGAINLLSLIIPTSQLKRKMTNTNPSSRRGPMQNETASASGNTGSRKFIGKQLVKNVGGVPCHGEIVGFRRCYKVRYENGTTENLIWSEVEPFLTNRR